MRILCNYPVESFQPRRDYRDVEVITYGPPDRKVIGGRHFPLDLAFDPSRGSLEELFALLPPGWRPDLVLLYYPGQEPLPRGIERCPVPVGGVISDWNLHFEQLWGLAPFFDFVLTDRLGTGIFRQAGFAEVAYWQQYTYRTGIHHPRPGVVRDIDIGFAGNMNPQVQGDRMRWLERVGRLGDRYRVFLGEGIYDGDYGLLLARSRIGFNRSIRGEMNLRAFEVCASGALLFMEEENLEVRDYLAPDREVVLYNEENLERKLAWFLDREEERTRIAEAGRERIRDYSFARNLERLRAVLAGIRAGIRPPAPAWRLHLARATAMSRTWAAPAPVLAEVVAALRLRPESAEAHNTAAVLLALHQPRQAGEELLREIGIARALDPRYLPARMNQAWILHRAGRTGEARREWEGVITLAGEVDSFTQLRGLVLPCRFTAGENGLRRAAALALLEGRAEHLARAYAELARAWLTGAAGSGVGDVQAASRPEAGLPV